MTLVANSKVVREAVSDPDAVLAQSYEADEAMLMELQPGGKPAGLEMPSPDAEPTAEAEAEAKVTPDAEPEAEAPAEPTSAPEPEPAAEPTTEPDAELDPRDAAIAELRKKLNDQGGTLGGRIQRAEDAVRENVAYMAALVRENAELKAMSGKPPAPPPEPPKDWFPVDDGLETEFPRTAEGLKRAQAEIDQRVGTVGEQAKAAQDVAARAEQRLNDLRFGMFRSHVMSKVPDYTDLIAKPEFKQILEQRPKGVNMTWGQIAQNAMNAYQQDGADPVQAAEAYVDTVQAIREAVEAETAAPVVKPTSDKPLKPTPDAQRGIDRSHARTATQGDPNMTKARLAEVEAACYDPDTPPQELTALHKEFEKLLDANLAGKLT